MPSTRNLMCWMKSKRKLRCCVAAVTASVILTSCLAETEKEGEVKPMVYEGMSVDDLENTLGKPDSVVKGGTVYDVASGRKKKVERLYFKKRTVVAIDDTVKVPDETRRSR